MVGVSPTEGWRVVLAWGVSPSPPKYFYVFSVSILISHAQSWLEVHQMGKTWEVRLRAQEALMQWGQRRKLRNGDSRLFPNDLREAASERGGGSVGWLL